MCVLTGVGTGESEERERGERESESGESVREGSGCGRVCCTGQDGDWTSLRRGGWTVWVDG